MNPGKCLVCSKFISPFTFHDFESQDIQNSNLATCLNVYEAVSRNDRTTQVKGFCKDVQNISGF
jgi:hypothetical protein